MSFDTTVSAGVNPSAASDTTLFTSTNQTSAIVTAANRTSSNRAVRIAHRRGGAALDDTMYKAYDFTLLPNEPLTVGPFFIQDTGIVTVRTDSTGVTFTLEGLSTS